MYSLERKRAPKELNVTVKLCAERETLLAKEVSTTKEKPVPYFKNKKSTSWARDHPDQLCQKAEEVFSS